MFLFIGFIFFIFVLIVLRDLRRKFSTAKATFRMDYLYQLSLYIFEIWSMFLLFQLVLFFYADSLGYADEGTLKRFIDFFTVYQIFIFVVLKLYDSLKIDAYSSLIFLLNTIIPHVENRELVPEGFEEEPDSEELKSLILPQEAENARTLILDLLREYRELAEDTVSSEAYIEGRLYSIKHQLYFLKSSLELSREERNFHWNVSLLQRLGKW